MIGDCARAGRWLGVVGPSVTDVALVEETLVREVDVDVDGGGGVVLVFWVRVEEGLGFVSAGGGRGRGDQSMKKDVHLGVYLSLDVSTDVCFDRGVRGRS